MTFENLLNEATKAMDKLSKEGKKFKAEDTVCVICSDKGNLFSGVNRSTKSGDNVQEIHAEADALQKMEQAGDKLVKYIIVVSAGKKKAILPCADCLELLASHGNAAALVAMPKKMHKLGDLTDAEEEAASYSASEAGNLLKNRINSLMEGLDEDDEDEEEEALLEELSKPKRKGLFGLFGKKD